MHLEKISKQNSKQALTNIKQSVLTLQKATDVKPHRLHDRKAASRQVLSLRILHTAPQICGCQEEFRLAGRIDRIKRIITTQQLVL